MFHHDDAPAKTSNMTTTSRPQPKWQSLSDHNGVMNSLSGTLSCVRQGTFGLCYHHYSCYYHELANSRNAKSVPEIANKQVLSTNYNCNFKESLSIWTGPAQVKVLKVTNRWATTPEQIVIWSSMNCWDVSPTRWHDIVWLREVRVPTLRARGYTTHFSRWELPASPRF